MKRRNRSVKDNVPESKRPDLGKTQNSSVKIELETNEDPNLVKKVKKSHKFTNDQTLSLIAAVKARPILWENNPEWSPSHIEDWLKIEKELNMEAYGYKVLRQKWMSLRKTFLKHSENLRAENVGHSDSMHYHVNWNFYDELSFLDDEDDHSSYIKLEPEVEILASPAPKKPCIQVSQQGECQSTQALITTTIPFDLIVEDNQLSNKVSKHFLDISTSTPIGKNDVDNNKSASHTPSPQCVETNRTFCNHLSTELRLLSDLRSRHLRSLLMRKVYEFMDLQREN